MHRTLALAAAESGLHVALGQIRASNGDIDELPCGPISGDVNPAGTARYQVSIDYVNTDPNGNVGTGYLESTAGNDAWVTGHRIACPSSGHGTASTPNYALLRSLGTDSATGSITAVPNRALFAVHKLATTNANIPGGQIHTWTTGTTQLCFDAGAAPAVGTTVRMQPCAGGAPQTWAYRPNLTLMLVSTEASTPLCLDGGSPHAVGAVVTLQQCGTTTQPRQQWSYNRYANFEGTTDGATVDGYCLNVETLNTAGSRIVLGSTAQPRCDNTFDHRQSFSPDPTVGAGAAPATTNGQTQLVNYKQFSRCVDIPGSNPKDNAWTMAWSCKQAPDGANVGWNQLWTLPTPGGNNVTAAGQISTTCANNPEDLSRCANGVVYCLRSPLSTAAGTRVAPVPCSDGGAGLTWTRYGEKATTYEQRYQIVDESGRCLTPLEGTELTSDGSSVLVVRTCDGSTLQKWNASANTDTGLPLQNVGER
ncbi:MAG TPA: ricin-type beta-trefoil lectin domain protein, partial [Actinoplanes sp.]|nr:ricin-type beta-trefoil lectin domain protein [Actinoplanes sp.]